MAKSNTAFSLKEVEFIKSIGKEDFHLIKLYSKKNSLLSLRSILLDWFLIVIAMILLTKNTYSLPITLLIIGSRQRALSNLTHDGSHYNLFNKKKWNDFITNIFCSFAMFETVESYRRSHVKHHLFLGDMKHDPDSFSHFKIGYNDLEPWSGDAFSNYLRLVFNKISIINSFYGSFSKLSIKEILLVFTWWTIVSSSVVVFVGANKLINFILLWFIARLTTYHLIRVLAEFLDHTGLKPEGILRFTRNLPRKSMIRFISHPNEDIYHITHHLFPKVPHYNLKKLNKILINYSSYSNAHHCDSFFGGEHSAFKCWIGICGRNL